MRASLPCAPRANTSPQQRLRSPQVIGLEEVTERVQGRMYVTMCHGEDSVSACLCVARCCLRLLPCFSPALVVAAVFRVGRWRLLEVQKVRAGVFPARGKVPTAPGQSCSATEHLFVPSARASNGSQDAAIEIPRSPSSHIALTRHPPDAHLLPVFAWLCGQLRQPGHAQRGRRRPYERGGAWRTCKSSEAKPLPAWSGQSQASWGSVH